METNQTIEVNNTSEVIGAKSGSDYLLSSTIEIAFVITATTLLVVLYKIKDKWLFRKLKLNYNFLKMFITDVMNSVKVATKKEAIEEKHKKNVEVKILDKMDEELFKKYESIINQKLSKNVPEDEVKKEQQDEIKEK